MNRPQPWDDTFAVNGNDLTTTAVGIFRGLAKSYERTLEIATLLQDRRWKKWLLSCLEVGPGDLVLDIGCGTCLLEEQMGRADGSVVGIDVSEPMIRIGQAKRLRGVRLLTLGDASALPFNDSSFDWVVSCYVPKYTRIEEFVPEVSRVLRPGGTVAMYDFARPKGPFSPFLALYTYGAIRLAGVLLGAARRKAAPTFQRLPGIIRETAWDSSAVALFGAKGIPGGTIRRLSWGAAVAFVATKPQSSTSQGEGRTRRSVGHSCIEGKPPSPA